MKGNNSLFSNCSSEKKTSSSSPLHGNSQPYQKYYSVYSKMMKKDIENGVYNPSGDGYIKNPTAKTLDSLCNGDYIIGADFNMEAIYVITQNGEIVVGKRNGFGRKDGALPTPHPTLLGGLDPKVKIAGTLVVRKGKIFLYNNESGHYRPNNKSLKFAEEAFNKYPKHKDFKGGQTWM